LFSNNRIDATTPDTDTSTRVFMTGSHNYALGRQRVTDRLRGLLDDVAQRDASILELASNHSGYDGWQAGVEFQADAAVTRTRELSGLCWPTKQADRQPRACR
jgi:Vanillate O-demethylase oxygenase C-terminal domain